ncbi:precorrin-6y C5,15-methyltransferase (decarboxylating) subunit CbiE [Aliamphritea spongicola]|uniref:precorrin-6y C5,15-methyltransferase (decarboxylating) subunit CbiE n=1 Tax=Aliamphritea spongicola TaxID=707589 RepID=UPI001FAF201A|nr:precorrin-6y C5,15-methyltransferase (decarboxylating) subunit CbiE [Aliamphritea spongicola]
MTAMGHLQLHIIGLGVSDKARLSAEAESGLNSAAIVIGSERQLETVAQLLRDDQRQVVLPKLSELKRQLPDMAADVSSIAILASGDPLFYGIGAWFGRTFAQAQLHYHPGVSSLQAACHRLGRSLQDVEVLSLHGRPLAKLRTRLRNRQPLLILTDDKSNPRALARECLAAGFSETLISVCETLGYPQEQVRSFTARQLAESSDLEFDPLHVSLVEPLLPQAKQALLPVFPGIPDNGFITDAEQAGRILAGNECSLTADVASAGKGLITKREVRLSILSLLQPAVDDTIWDIGAGCGSVAIELSYWQPRCRVLAIEHHEQRLACLTANQQRYGVSGNLQVVAGRAPQALNDLPSPNKIFIGGSDGEMAGLLQQCWALLPPGGVLLASAVTENSKQQLLSFYEQRCAADDSQPHTVQIGVSRGEQLAGQLMYRPNLPVNLYSFCKR